MRGGVCQGVGLVWGWVGGSVLSGRGKRVGKQGLTVCFRTEQQLSAVIWENQPISQNNLPDQQNPTNPSSLHCFIWRIYQYQPIQWLLPSLLILVSVVYLRRGVKTIRLTDFVKLPREGGLLVIETIPIQNYPCITYLGGLLVIETYQQGPRSDSTQVRRSRDNESS